MGCFKPTQISWGQPWNNTNPHLEFDGIWIGWYHLQGFLRHFQVSDRPIGIPGPKTA